MSKIHINDLDKYMETGQSKQKIRRKKKLKNQLNIYLCGKT